MPDDDLALLACTDQWNACLDELIRLARRHLQHCPQPELDCPGAGVSLKLETLDLAEATTLVELAVVRLAKAGAR